MLHCPFEPGADDAERDEAKRAGRRRGALKMASEQLELAAQRTWLAFQRSRLGVDRTLLAIMRTALAMIGFSFTA